MRPVKSVIPAIIILATLTYSYADYYSDTYEAKYEAFLEAVRTRDGETATLLYRGLLNALGVRYRRSENVRLVVENVNFKIRNTISTVLRNGALNERGRGFNWDYGLIDDDEGDICFFDYGRSGDLYFAAKYYSYEFGELGWINEYTLYQGFLDGNWSGIVTYSDWDCFSDPYIVYDPINNAVFWFYIWETYLGDMVYCRNNPIAVHDYSYLEIDADIAEYEFPVVFYTACDGGIWYYYFGISFDGGDTFTITALDDYGEDRRSGTHYYNYSIACVPVEGVDRIYVVLRDENTYLYSDDYGLTWSGGGSVFPSEYLDDPWSTIVGPVNVVDGVKEYIGIGAAVRVGEPYEYDVYYARSEDSGEHFDLFLIEEGADLASRHWISTSKHILNDKVYISIPLVTSRSYTKAVFRSSDISDLLNWDCSVIGYGNGLYPIITHGYYSGNVIPVGGVNVWDSAYYAGYVYCEDYTVLEDIGLVALEGENGVVVKWGEMPLPYNSFNIYRRTGNYFKSDSYKGDLLNETPITGSPPYEYTDIDIKTGVTYTYWLEAIDVSGVSDWYGPITCTVGVKPYTFSLSQNRPNPVSSEMTKFAFSVPEAGKAELDIYDLSGRKVGVVIDRYLEPGEYEMPYTAALPPGVYMYRLNACGESACRKMVVLE
jgi:hypothetical protein